ncbi:hypothetical protein L21SP4_00998 [Kiritimatiella glycovorans]|uniref:Uncharacterized protein n=1 Tax=Kiritimatiella glycovorans TaxID=1307763 RepID=A0A0G3EFS2_9BACT|nr:hypothetical protein L21SP4_00998 [Kiritimatiella glycovorans]
MIAHPGFSSAVKQNSCLHAWVQYEYRFAEYEYDFFRVSPCGTQVLPE